jgi:hypothetical protein
MKSRLVFAALVGAACFLSSCGGDDDEGPIEPPDETPPVRNRPDSLLASWLERAYNEQDADLYEEMLDADFTFRFLPDDADTFEVELGLDANDSWSRAKDIQSTTNMFNDNEVSDVFLDVGSIQDNDYPGVDCDDCRELTANVAVRVTTHPPGAQEPEVLVTDSPQVFLVRPDPADTTLWVLFRQLDRPRPAKTHSGGDDERGISSNEERTWGQIKAQFF